jgi:hypothetical protein
MAFGAHLGKHLRPPWDGVSHDRREEEPTSSLFLQILWLRHLLPRMLSSLLASFEPAQDLT